MISRFKKFIANIDGATAIEYAMIASLVSVAIIGGATAIGTNSVVTMETLVNSMK